MSFLALTSGGAVLASTVALASPAAVASPHLAVTAVHPITVRGARFLPRERVRVVVTTGAGKGTRYVRASRTGTFAVRFTAVRVAPCPWYVVRATGNRGSRAVLRLMPECPNGPAD